MMDTNPNPNGYRNPVEVRLETSSGFVLYIRPLPPYYLDVVKEQLPMPDYPKRVIKLASGDKIPWDYTPEEGAELDPSHDDYELWMKWKVVDTQRLQVAQDREIARRKFLLSNCVRVESGPYTVDDDDWVYKVEAAFKDYTIPTHPGKRMLMFLITQVITSSQEMEVIVSSAVHKEVSMQSIVDALQRFQHNLEETSNIRGS
jgi:hypothetical protein